MESNNLRRKRWNLLGFIASVFITFAIIGLIIFSQGHKEQLEVVLSILTVVLVIALFAVIRAQVSFMGLEVIGYAEKNYSKVWVDSDCFIINLAKAIDILDNSHIQTRIFNVPHCLLRSVLWPFACKSISEWKKTNLGKCKKCSKLDECCSLFSTSIRQSYKIEPIIE